MGFMIFTFFAVFLLIASAGLLLFYRQAVLERLTEVISPRARRQRSLKAAIQEAGSSLSGVMGRLEQLLPKSQAEVSLMSQKLMRAGYRNESAIRVFYGSKVMAMLLLCVAASVMRLWLPAVNPFLIYIVALVAGFMLPDLWLDHLINKRQKRITRGLPDVLDMLVICVEAGLSLDQATARTAKELDKAHPDLCDELGVVVLEQHAGRPRADAWRDMAARTGSDSLRNMVTMLVQSEQLGTSIARSLRVYADTLRTQRVQAIEELASKTSVKLVFPLVFFIFPALFVVILGPAVIRMVEMYHKLGH